MTKIISSASDAAHFHWLAETRTLSFDGAWTVHTLGPVDGPLRDFAVASGGPVKFDGREVIQLDTAGGWLVARAARRFRDKGCEVSFENWQADHQALIELVEEEASAAPAPAHIPKLSALACIGRHTWNSIQQLVGMLAFVGETAVVALRLLAAPWRIRWKGVFNNLQMAGFNALPIVGLLSFLMGIVIAYQGADQLSRYGANIFVADLVGLSMLRELAPLLTAIIVAGRSGSAYAAQIGTMQVNEEIDALRTTGISPYELLVMPKVIALIVALPLLTVYADIMGVFGGMVMAQWQLGVSYENFLERFNQSIGLNSYLVGLGKAPVFAAIIAMVGCYQGFRVRGGADSVGKHTTISVVQSIFVVIIADAIFSVIFSWLRI